MLERRVHDDGATLLVSTDLEREGFMVAFTERSGGVSDGPFASLNLGFTAGDDPDRVRENRFRVCRALQVEPFARGWQVHGTGVTEVTAELAGAGFYQPETAIPRTDAMVTTERGVALSILAADCVPVALVDLEGGRLGVVHAGWRGVAAGILTGALRHFPDPSRVAAVIGPAVGPDHYAVGDAVATAIQDIGGPAAVVLRDSDGAIAVDLPGTVERLLEAAGVTVTDRAAECTACQPGRFFSYRRDGVTGRHALIAVRR
jgi:YfiH family protein